MVDMPLNQTHTHTEEYFVYNRTFVQPFEQMGIKFHSMLKCVSICAYNGWLNFILRFYQGA